MNDWSLIEQILECPLTLVICDEQLRDQQANDLLSAFIANKIRERVNDPAVADTLIPKNHGFGSRRVPMETHYYEAYNRSNVRLVDLNKTPIERITEKGIDTSTEKFAFDMMCVLEVVISFRPPVAVSLDD